MSYRSLHWVLGLAMISGCAAPAPGGETGSSSSGTAGSDTTVGQTNAGPTGDSTGSAASATSTTGSTTADSSGELPPPQCPPMTGESQCDPYAQDCPEGYHCIPQDQDEDGALDTVLCGPLAQTPADDHTPCTIDLAGCTDDCPLGSFCEPSSEDPSAGLCLPMCDYQEGEAACAAGQFCQTCADCGVGTCLVGCDPLAPECSGPLDNCLLIPYAEGFVCVDPPDGNVGVGEECFYVNDCMDGTICAMGEAVGDCPGFNCCTELCDLSDGDPGCSNPAHICLSVFGPSSPPAGQEHVGYCALPEADPCLVPGVCPPPGIDDTLPWCSDSNDDDCRDGALAGYGDIIACESGCVCTFPCQGAGAGDCPVPPTGTAVPQCVVEPFGVGSPTSCMLSCAAGETCPDGMTCTSFLSGEPLCVWVSPIPPEEC